MIDILAQFSKRFLLLTILDCYFTLFAMSLTFCVSSVSKNCLEEKSMWSFLFTLLSGTSKGFIKLLLSIFLVVNLLWFYFLISLLHKIMFITEMSIPVISFTQRRSPLYLYRLFVSHQMRPYSSVIALCGSSYTFFTGTRVSGWFGETGTKYPKLCTEMHTKSNPKTSAPNLTSNKPSYKTNQY